MVRRIRPSLSRMPSPQSSTPQLLLTVSRSRVPERWSASMRATGMPQRPKPPTAREAPSGISATASSALATTLSITVPPHRGQSGRLQSEFPCNQHQLHFRGALPDLKDLRVTVVAGHGEFIDESIAAEHLGGVAGIVHGCLTCDH